MPRAFIIGGGPAGSACGIELAKKGIETIVFEAGSMHRDKTCGDGLIPDAQKALSYLGLLEKVQQNSFNVKNAVIYAKYGERIEINLPILVLPRKNLDQILRNEVEANNGKVYYDCRISDIKVDENCVVVKDFTGKEYEGDVAVLATGASKLLAKKLNFTFTQPTGIAIRGYALNTKNIGECYFWMMKSIAPAYAWAFPCPDNLLNVGLGFYLDDITNNRRCIDDMLYQFVEQEGKEVLGNVKFIEKPKSWPFCCGLRKEKNYCDRIVLVGENVDCTYDLTGEGIGKALQSGIAAAKAIAKSSNEYKASELAVYQEEFEKETMAFYEGYAYATSILKKPFVNYFFIKILRHSNKAREQFASIIREEMSAKDLFSVNGIAKLLF